ncbi:hypothetical protein GWI33_011657 [Rhynchophorus ferrugineus]|uniref:Lipase domain-containing protein n=1 Tax=Rhynchophorus ferrugineus TaxID=354439 RepID=A0A834I7N2_RHYFE|nr:hypothetical protein GWI33_011657 [Rhynchophorus ferrugineus]
MVIQMPMYSSVIYHEVPQPVGLDLRLMPCGICGGQPSIPADERLDKDDAEIVDVIHTDAGFYGYENPIGTLDIYVNRGKRIQPGCLDVWEHQSVGNIIEACEAYI